jgi:hypothetical protein
MEAETVSKTLGFNPQLMWFVAQEEFIRFDTTYLELPLTDCSKRDYCKMLALQMEFQNQINIPVTSD